MTWPNDMNVDSEYWDGQLLWMLCDAAAISKGIDPRVFLSEDASGDCFHKRGPKCAMNEIPGFRNYLNHIVTLAKNNAFKTQKDGVNDDVPMYWCVLPSDFLSYFSKPIPKGPVSESKSTAVVAAMLAEWPGDKKHPSLRDLENAAMSIGVSVKKDTISKVLNAAIDISRDLELRK